MSKKKERKIFSRLCFFFEDVGIILIKNYFFLNHHIKYVFIKYIKSKSHLVCAEQSGWYIEKHPPWEWHLQRGNLKTSLRHRYSLRKYFIR